MKGNLRSIGYSTVLLEMSYPSTTKCHTKSKLIEFNPFSLHECLRKRLHNHKMICYNNLTPTVPLRIGERGGSVVECRTPEREVGGWKPTAAVLCP